MFIYVFDVNMKDALVSLGFEIIMSDTDKNMFIFCNRKESFDLILDDKFSGKYLISDVMTF